MRASEKAASIETTMVIATTQTVTMIGVLEEDQEVGFVQQDLVTGRA